MKIYNRRMICFLADHGVYPIYEDNYSCAVYKRTDKLCKLLDTYIIQSYLLPNKR